MLSYITLQLEPDRQTLIERIVKLQKINAKHSEKIEFLDEHITQLLAEIKKKNRVIQYYVLREQSGVLSSDRMDQHKVSVPRHFSQIQCIYVQLAICTYCTTTNLNPRLNPSQTKSADSFSKLTPYWIIFTHATIIRGWLEFR